MVANPEPELEKLNVSTLYQLADKLEYDSQQGLGLLLQAYKWRGQ